MWINDLHELSLSGRKSVSLILGAGFSAPMGYPTGDDMNNGLLYFDDSTLDFSPTGYLTSSKDGTKPKFQMDGIYNKYQKLFIYCKRLIKEYTKAHGNKFYYEAFYDFIKTDEAKEKRYQSLCDDLLSGTEDFDYYLSNVPHIYNQMVAHLLKDREGKSWYNEEPYKLNDFEGYNGFLTYLSELSKEFIVNVHTLNHDLLFESFNNTGLINGNISDGFDEYSSDYYGKLFSNNMTYHCRLERYMGRYKTPIRLYKLHGSLDYVPFYRQNKYGYLIPENYVKIKWGIGASDIMKARKSKIGYDFSPFEYHADFLTGTTSKIQRYNEPLLFRKLFKKFKKNLRKAELLIIIGYGCKDERINEMIRNNFDFKHKQSFIVDAYAKDGSQVDAIKEELHAKLLRVPIDSINKGLFV
ncbi:MAG: hypothetical protein J6T04_09485 [Bacteroidales bacterium]|nr:hypothetical protein [Bacteroidales bacterium]